ncbi:MULTISPECIES: fumarylacetoacetate hydrolase family protein [unclassified Bradyrhizobium]|uniref:fumarylacetoacetate hydrolase family protein n=1 Tax=unclassified Bradyrhizobium TaxID=2631580 RepID=UPI002917138B|nr:MULTISPECIES: fumarylacetoacetate hydrolase family protein [unclassified Bradyrhizobium]
MGSADGPRLYVLKREANKTGAVVKIANFEYDGRARLGKILGDTVVDLSAAAPELPKLLVEILRLGAPAMDKIAEVQPVAGAVLPLGSVRLLAPIPNPSKYLAIGMNYHDHAEEARKAGIPIPQTQVWFNKQVSCIVGPYDNVVRPNVSERLDYEAELGVVIGKRCRHVKAADARSVIAGYLVTNDVTVRDWQQRSPTWTLGKSFDTHGPIGPWLTTADDVPDPHALRMRLFVNGELRQDTLTGGMIYNIFQQIEHLTTVMTLEPGDILATGTCSGVGIALKPPSFLNPGDVVRVEIDGLGNIENRVVPDGDPAARAEPGG